MRKKYTNLNPTDGISATHRRLLSQLHRIFSGPFTVEEATEACNLTRARARRLLAYWASRGWLSRIKRGLYITVPLEAKYPAERKENPWIVAATVFDPSYLGGWTAGEHWELTDQIFSDIVVYTTRHIRNRKQVIQNTTYIIKVISPHLMTGMKNVWIKNIQVKVSDPSRTIADILSDPHLGGGIRHVADMLEEYFGSEHRNDSALIEYIKLLGNRTSSKRLGYLVESMGIKAPEVINFCHQYKSTGYSKLDPGIKNKGRLVRRWNLEINARIEKGTATSMI